jgi:hypothetical protein
MLRSILFDIAFLGFGGALLIAGLNVPAAIVSLAIGVVAASASRPGPERSVLRRSGRHARWFVPVQMGGTA